MNKSFMKELLWTNYLFIGGFAVIIIVSALYYGASPLAWSRTLGILPVLALALIVKMKRIKTRTQELDERIQYLYYRSLTIGFYFLLGAVLWFYAKEMVVDGKLSLRTYVELFAGLAGYLGSYTVFKYRS